MPTEAEILEVARREASTQFLGEFEPITKGPVYAVIALIPLCISAAAFIVWRKLPWSRQER